MLRPSTPLSVVLFAAFGLLLLSVLSTPVITAVPLGNFKDFTFGVFGFCEGNKCSSISIGYDMSAPLGTDNKSFDIPQGVRDSLPTILVVHPVAAFLALVLFIMAVVSHWHSPAHSSRYLLAFFILSVIAFIISLLAFVVDVLLFTPNMAWGSYIVLAATILLGVSAVVSCAMRRTLISRKTRRKKIAENAEMSGQNYYNREDSFKPQPSVVAQSSIAMTSANGATVDSLPAFATFEHPKKDDTVSDERIPLTSRSPSNGATNNRLHNMNSSSEISAMSGPMNGPRRSASRDQYGNHIMPNAGEMTPMTGTRRSASRDQYGNPMVGLPNGPPPNNGPPNGYGVPRGPSTESMRSRGSQGYRGGRGGYGRGGHDMYGAPMRGRGGYGPPGRGGYGPRGGRGGAGLAPPPRGGYMGGGMRGGRGPPPGPPHNGVPHDRRPSPAEAYGVSGPYSQPMDDGYIANLPINQSAPDVNTGYAAYNPDNDYARAESPPPMAGNAIEMDATSSEHTQGYGPYGGLRDNDSDVAGMVGLQQGHAPQRHETYMSSKYSTDGLSQYLPPRAEWNQDEGRNSPLPASPMVNQLQHPLPTDLEPVAQPASQNYYEDVDPRFAQSPTTYEQPSYSQPPQVIEPVYEDVHQTLPAGARSPAGSERSNFTSISQRGVNPQWDPPPPMPHQQVPSRRPVQQQRDMLLDNPDFQIPGSRPGGGPRGGPGMASGGAYPTGPL